MTKIPSFLYALLPFIPFTGFIAYKALNATNEPGEHELPAIVFDSGTSGGAPTVQSLNDRLDFVLDEFQDRATVAKLERALTTGELVVAWADMPVPAKFEVLHIGGVVDTLEDLASTEVQAVITFDRAFFVSIGRENSVTLTQLGILHEFAHYEQWLREETAMKRYWIKDLSVTRNFKANYPFDALVYCEEHLRYEREASQAECSSPLVNLLSGHEADQNARYCAGYDTPEYVQLHRERLLRSDYLTGICP